MFFRLRAVFSARNVARGWTLPIKEHMNTHLY